MSVSGLIAFISNNPYVAGIVGTGLECSKILMVIHAHRQWEVMKLQWKIMYSFVIIALICMTMIEVTGFITLSHNVSTELYQKSEGRSVQLAKESKVLEEEINRFDKMIDAWPENWYTKRIRAKKEFSYDEKRKRLLEIAQAQTQIVETSKIEFSGPIFATARTLDISPQWIARAFIFFIVPILELVAILLAIAVSVLWWKPIQTNGTKEQDFFSPADFKKLKAPLPDEDNSGKSNLSEDEQRQEEFRRFIHRQSFDPISGKPKLTPRKIALIVGCKKIKTVKRWLNNERVIPEKSMRALRYWERQENYKKKGGE